MCGRERATPQQAAIFTVLSCMLVALSSAGSGCNSTADCALRGACEAGLCRCEAAWTGPNCLQLNLLPGDATGIAAWHRNTSSSWGGSVVGPVGGKYHMFAADMKGHCGLDSWEGNSMVGRTEPTCTVAEPWCKSFAPINSWLILYFIC